MLKIFRNLFSHRPAPPSAGNTGKIDLAEQLTGFYGEHRDGWPFALSLLAPLHQEGGIYFDSFIERTFCWHPQGPRATQRPWIGVIHVPPGVPPWFQSEQSNEAIFAGDLWQQSLPFCRGLFTMSAYHRRELEKKLNLPIENLIFPCPEAERPWNMEAFLRNPDKKIVQIGWWLRQLHTIFQLPAGDYRKVFLRVNHTDIDGLLDRERKILQETGAFDEAMYRTVETMSYLDNAAYDHLLSENIVIIRLYDSSANNTIVECIARQTPILVNPIEAVVEYLGSDYPLYFDSLSEAAAKAADFDLLEKTHIYLKNLTVREQMRPEQFVNRFCQSRIYQSL